MGNRHSCGMVTGRAGRVVAALVVLLLGGCAARQTVVLVPDRQGHVGQVEVTTGGGKQVLTKAGDMTQVRDHASAPSTVTTADPAYVATAFGDALAVEPTPSEKFILYFETGTTDLRSDSQPVIADVVAAVKRRAAVAIAISGHTDATGSDQINDRLALARAEKVKELLMQQGVAQDLISVSSHGKGNPAIPTAEGVAEPRNRRVEVIVR